MSALFDESLRQVLKVSASKEPVPGGGSVAAIATAFAASMGAMVCNLTVGKKRYKAVEAQAVSARDELLGAMSRAEELVEADMAVFGRFMECYKMPAGTPEEKEQRDALIEEALKGATETPIKIAKLALEILELVDKIAPIGNRTAISDAGVAAYLADAGLRSALLNVDINVPDLKDRAFALWAQEEKDSLLARAEELKSRSVSTVLGRLAGQ